MATLREIIGIFTSPTSTPDIDISGNPNAAREFANIRAQRARRAGDERRNLSSPKHS